MSEVNWFESWFDSKYYHILYKNRDYTEAERFIANLNEVLSIPKNSQILDLACGKGRHSIYLNKLGYTVTGADLSLQSIEFASQFKNESLDFLVHDMRETLPNREFDYIFNLFTSFGYFDDDAEDQKVIDAVASNLKIGGTLVLDYMNPKYVIDNLVEDEIVFTKEVGFDIYRRVREKFIEKRILFHVNDVRHEYIEKVKILTKENFVAFFEKAGLQLKSIRGNYALDAFDENISERMIFIVEKL